MILGIIVVLRQDIDFRRTISWSFNHLKCQSPFSKCIKMKKAHRHIGNCNFKFHVKNVLISTKTMNWSIKLIIHHTIADVVSSNLDQGEVYNIMW